MTAFILLQAAGDGLGGVVLLFIGLIVSIAFILIMRLLGAWMLRINELLRHQEIQIKHQQSQLARLNDIISILEKGND
jgi:hypothetical protein